MSTEEEQWRTCSPRSQKTSPSGGEVRPPEPGEPHMNTTKAQCISPYLLKPSVEDKIGKATRSCNTLSPPQVMRTLRLREAVSLCHKLVHLLNIWQDSLTCHWHLLSLFYSTPPTPTFFFFFSYFKSTTFPKPPLEFHWNFSGLAAHAGPTDQQQLAKRCPHPCAIA